MDKMSIRIGTNVPCIMKEQSEAQYKPVFLIYVPDEPANAPTASPSSTIEFYFVTPAWKASSNKTIWIENSAGSNITDQKHNDMFDDYYIPYGSEEIHHFTFTLENGKYKLTDSTLKIIYSVSGSNITLL